jgi:FdhE protein
MNLSDQTTLDILNAHRARRPELAHHLDLYIAILQTRASIELPSITCQLPLDADARLARGEPILHADELACDWNAVAQLAREICAIAAHHRSDGADTFTELAREFTSPARMQQLARDYLSRTLRAHHESLDTFILTHALHPWLAAAARELESRVSNDAWHRGICPICGGDPDFAALEKDGGAWRLLCARCDFDWTFARAHCPFCGAEQITYFPSKDGAYRLYTCDNCQRYLKTIDLRELARDAHLPAERVLTIEMDYAARRANWQFAPQGD